MLQPARLGLGYVAAQLAGAVVGSAAAFWSLPSEPWPCLDHLWLSSMQMWHVYALWTCRAQQQLGVLRLKPQLALLEHLTCRMLAETGLGMQASCRQQPWQALRQCRQTTLWPRCVAASCTQVHLLP